MWREKIYVGECGDFIWIAYQSNTHRSQSDNVI